MSKKQTIVIKKIIVQGGGHHGGSWKVALADFMTALMAFFLVMWLVGQNEETKKAVSDYFSTPSVIEYNFQNYGAEITLEKLFLDLVNEPMKAAQSFLEPADKTPNVLDMGSSKVVAAFMADKLTDNAQNVSISQDGFEFDIPDTYLFDRGTAQPNKKFIEVMDRLTMITSGLQDSEVKLTSMIYSQTVRDGTMETAKKVAQDRLELISNKVRASFEQSTNSVYGATIVKEKKGEIDREKVIGYLHFSIHQKPEEKSKKSHRKLESLFGGGESEVKGFENIRNEIDRKNRKPQSGSDARLKFENPAEQELRQLKSNGIPDTDEE